MDTSQLFDTLKAGVIALAKSTLQDYVSQATQDGQNTIDQFASDIERWAEKVASGDLTVDNVKFLAEGKKELMEMKALEQIGIARIEIDNFKSGIVDLIVTTISKML